MGQVVGGLVKALSCQDCARYIFNDAMWRSTCCDKEECCKCDVETHEIEIKDDTSELSIEVEGCFGLHNK